MFRWAQLRDMVDQKRAELERAHRMETFRIDCQETVSWIEDKTRTLEDADQLTNDLTGVMKLQRRLSMMERDLGAISVCNVFQILSPFFFKNILLGNLVCQL